MATPDGRYPVTRGQAGIGVIGDVGHGKVRGDKTVGESKKGHAQEDKMPLCEGACHVHPGYLPAPGAENWVSSEKAAEAEGDNQREVSEFRDHLIYR